MFYNQMQPITIIENNQISIEADPFTMAITKAFSVQKKNSLILYFHLGNHTENTLKIAKSITGSNTLNCSEKDCLNKSRFYFISSANPEDRLDQITFKIQNTNTKISLVVLNDLLELVPNPNSQNQCKNFIKKINEWREIKKDLHVCIETSQLNKTSYLYALIMQSQNITLM